MIKNLKSDVIFCYIHFRGTRFCKSSKLSNTGFYWYNYATELIPGILVRFFLWCFWPSSFNNSENLVDSGEDQYLLQKSVAVELLRYKLSRESWLLCNRKILIWKKDDYVGVLIRPFNICVTLGKLVTLNYGSFCKIEMFPFINVSALLVRIQWGHAWWPAMWDTC